MPSDLSSGDAAALEYAHFRVQRKADGTPWTLGVGGMGMTYKATDTSLDKDVALKVIHPSRIGDTEVQRLFVREARAAARVNHPNVAAVSFLEDRAGAFFYAMEFVEGVSLHSHLRRQGPLPPARALAFAEQIALGLGAIHGQGLIHRDLKPANVMVTELPHGHPRRAQLASSGGCELKIIDFGLARNVVATDEYDPDAPLPTIGFRGTAAYASPEQCEEETDLDARSDLYSLGCILWELLAGRPPFRGRSQREVINHQVATPPPWVELVHAPLPALALLRRFLAKQREDRFPDADAAAQAIAKVREQVTDPGFARGDTHVPALADEMPAPTPPTVAPAATAPTVTATATATAPTPTSGTRLTVELPPRWWVGALALFLFVGAGVAWLWYASRRPPAPPPPAAAVVQEPPTVAVLRFTDLASDADGAAFARGMSDDLLAALGKVHGLRIVSLNSPSVPADPAALGLARAAFLEGSVRREGSRVRIVTRLSAAEGGRQLWGETYERELVDAWEFQRSVAEAIARALSAQLTPAEQQALARRPTKSAEAYDLLVKARALWQSGPRGKAGNEEVVALCQRAVALDPGFALAWAYLARGHNQIYFHAHDRSPGRLAQAKAAAETAIRLQPDLAEAHIVFARVQWFENPEPETLLRGYQLALAIAPGNPELLAALSDIHRQRDHHDEALAASREAVARAPDDAGKLASLAHVLTEMNRRVEAEEWYRRAAQMSGLPGRALSLELCIAERTGDWERFTARARELAPKLPRESRWQEQWRARDYAGALETLRALPGNDVAFLWQRVPKTLFTSALHRALGDETAALADGRAALATMQSGPPGPLTVAPGWQMMLAFAHARADDHAQALAAGEKALQAAPPAQGMIVTVQMMEDLAELCAEIGEKDRACDLLDALLARPWAGSRIRLRHEPAWDGLRGFPRFERMIAARP